MQLSIIIKFAELPELTNTEYFDPFHLENLFSNSFTFLNWVNLLFFLIKLHKLFIDFLSNYCTFTINIDDDIIDIELEPNSIIVLDINVSNYDFTNLYITNLNIIHTLELIKFDFYY